jgi:hypothetical protein
VIPLSGRVPGRASRPSQSRIDDGGGLQYVSWKIDHVFRVFCRGEYIGRRATSGGGPSGPTTWWCDHGLARTTPWCGWRLVPLRLSFGLRHALEKIGTSAFVSSNSKNIFSVAFLKHKNSRKQGTGTVAPR